MSGIDWMKLADLSTCSEEELLRRAKLEAAMAQAGRDRYGRPLAQNTGPSPGRAIEPPLGLDADPPPATSAEKTQALGFTCAPSNPPRACAPDPVDVLQAALDAAPDDTQRAQLLAAAPRSVREQLQAGLLYRQLDRAAEADPYADFSRALDAAPDDEARKALIAGKDAAFLSQWSWHLQHSDADYWERRYLDVAGDSLQ